MHALFSNIFFNKDKQFDDCVNICYWIVLITKNVLKWLFVFYVVESYKALLIAILLFSPVVKFVLIGLKNLKHFREKFRRSVFIVFMLIEVLIECFFELPVHFFFPRNIIYYHSIYFKIYDKTSYRGFECLSEMIENAIVIYYLIQFFMNNTKGLSIISILLIVFSCICLLFFCFAKFYFFFIDPPQTENNEGKDFYGLTVNKEQAIPYEIRNVNNQGYNKIERYGDKGNHSGITKEHFQKIDSDRHDLVELDK